MGNDYREAFDALNWYVENKLGEDSENNRIENLKILRAFLSDTIHNKLAKVKTEENEKAIRYFCKYVVVRILPFLKRTIERYNFKMKLKILTDEQVQYFGEYLDLEDDYLALASFRSLIHFAEYMERQDDEADKVWTYTMDKTMGSIFYYSNAMILNHTYNSLVKCTPTGYGKSKSDCVIISFILGYDTNANIMKVVGNKSVLDGIAQRVVNMLMSQRYGKVFPEIGKYKGSKDMFKKYKIADGLFLLKDSDKEFSFACFNKETKISGIRAMYQFFDDITQQEDAENVIKHLDDVRTYQGVWSKREYNQYLTLRWFTGTMYHREDFLSQMIKHISNGLPLIVDMKTQGKKDWARFVKLSNDKKGVIIRIPKLVDLDLGEDKCWCSFPEKFSKEEALKLYHSPIAGTKREFYAMEQQNPLPPESLKFDYVYLRTYEKLPKEILSNNCVCRLIIDPSRKGKDNYAGLIFKSIDGKKDWYFVDCFYEKNKTSKYAIPEICEKGAKHLVDIISFEQNTTDPDLLVSLIKNELAKTNCKEYTIDDFWSNENKEEKILACSDDIIENIIFPVQNMFYSDSPMGRAMSDIVNYSFSTKNMNDDSIDCCAMLMRRLKQDSQNSIEILDIDFRL